MGLAKAVAHRRGRGDTLAAYYFFSSLFRSFMDTESDTQMLRYAPVSSNWQVIRTLLRTQMDDHPVRPSN